MKKHWDAILDVTAIVLANLCVSYIMTTQVGGTMWEATKGACERRFPSACCC